jgi:hypothetical protein
MSKRPPPAVHTTTQAAITGPTHATGGPAAGAGGPTSNLGNIPPDQLRPDGTLTGNPYAPELPVDNSGAPPAVLADHGDAMDDRPGSNSADYLTGWGIPHLKGDMPDGQPFRTLPK